VSVVIGEGPYGSCRPCAVPVPLWRDALPSSSAGLKYRTYKIRFCALRFICTFDGSTVSGIIMHLLMVVQSVR